MYEGIDPGISHRAVRILFKYDGEHMEVVDQQPIDMVAFPSDSIDVENVSGIWHEVQDAQGAVLYRRVIHPPLANHIEVPTGDDEHPLAYRPAEGASQLLTIIVPDFPEARSLVLFERRPDVSLGARDIPTPSRPPSPRVIGRIELGGRRSGE